ncbi:HD family phosphohydrolase [Salisaeta longa]|uniref:HD family phosphohydrolase n=1 Tax=Salisaeta longa TaxID=503170 RepID=UPI0003B4A2AB|nr:HDIG domain-containing metalloprotein [Salisaeta longa]
MDILEKIGWRKPKARPVGQSLERGRAPGDDGTRRALLLRVGLFVALLAAAVLAFPQGDTFEYTVQVGDVWRQPTLVAPFNFPVYKDPALVQAQRDSARATAPPYARVRPNALNNVQARRDTLRKQLDEVVSAYAAAQYHSQQGDAAKARSDSLRYVELRRNTPVMLTPQQWRMLVQYYVDNLEGLSQATRNPSAPTTRLDVRLLDAAYTIAENVLQQGVLNVARDTLAAASVIIRNEEERVQQRVPIDQVYGLKEAYQYAEQQLKKRFPQHPQWVEAGMVLFRDIFQPSLHYLAQETAEERKQRAQTVSPIQGGVERGSIVVSKGERVTPAIKQKLTSLERVRNERTEPTILWQRLSGEILFGVLTFGFFFLYLFALRPSIWRHDRSFLIVNIPLLIAVLLFAGVVRLPWASLYVVPVPLIVTVLTIIFNSRLGLFSALTLALMGGQIVGLDLEYTFATFIASAVGVFSVRDIKNRGQFFGSALVVLLAYMLVLVAGWLYMGTPVERLGTNLLYASIGASFTIAGPMLLWTLERLFDITTDLTLLELSDTNRPLLKELSLKAPGSFNHSMQVANLAEAAADRIGANALLVRVGGLYHDIGKMKKPEYFVENQSGTNPHDTLKPKMSALIIASHVKEGVKMAKEHNLPQRVLQFIPTHHGTSRIEYFYRKAQEDRAEDAPDVLESEFRYPGPRPHSKETGILMLADGVEAASRSLDDPSRKRLQSLIDLIFKDRIEDGQLDDTDLTFRDLQAIKETFLKMLTGIHHVRVKYPDQDDEEAPEGTADAPDAPTEQQPIVSVAPGGPEAFNNAVSVLMERDVWGTPEQSISIDNLRNMPGIRPHVANKPAGADSVAARNGPAPSEHEGTPAARDDTKASPASDDKAEE